jgi:ATP-binding cassette subfamily F protein 3
LWLVKDGAVTPFDGDMDEYKKLIMSSNKTSGNKENKRSKDKEDKPTTASTKKINPVKLKSEIRRLDSQIEKLASQKSALEAEMLKTDFYSVNDSAEIARKTKTFSEIAIQLEKAEESWLELQEQL